QTPLHEAARRNNTHLARVMIDAGADVDHADRFDHTPLHVAAMRGHRRTVDLLARRGGDLTRTDANGRTPGELLNEAEPTLVDHFISLGRL
ncbi:MAG: ankyrin repeat domain-containing protein, partial [Phycisphaeraceae bacterium]